MTDKDTISRRIARAIEHPAGAGEFAAPADLVARIARAVTSDLRADPDRAARIGRAIADGRLDTLPGDDAGIAETAFLLLVCANLPPGDTSRDAMGAALGIDPAQAQNLAARIVASARMADAGDAIARHAEALRRLPSDRAARIGRAIETGDYDGMTRQDTSTGHRIAHAVATSNLPPGTPELSILADALGIDPDALEALANTQPPPSAAAGGARLAAQQPLPGWPPIFQAPRLPAFRSLVLSMAKAARLPTTDQRFRLPPDADTEETAIRAGKRHGTVTLSLNRAALPPGLRATRMITILDRRICDAIANLHDAGHDVFTAAEAWRAMNGITDAKTHPSEAEAEAINAALLRLAMTMATIEGPGIRYTGNLAYLERITISNRGRIISDGWHLIGGTIPILPRYSRAIGQIMTVPAEALRAGGDYSGAVADIRDYIIAQAHRIQGGEGHGRILYKSILAACDPDALAEDDAGKHARQRRRAAIARILDGLRDQGIVAAWEGDADGVTITTKKHRRKLPKKGGKTGRIYGMAKP